MNAQVSWPPKTLPRVRTTRGRAPATRSALERMYKPRLGLNDISVLSQSSYGPLSER